MSSQATRYTWGDLAGHLVLLQKIPMERNEREVSPFCSA